MLPAELRRSYVSQRGLTSEQARLIAGSPGTAWFFDQVVSLGTDPRSAANWITQDLAGLLNAAKADLVAVTAAAVDVGPRSKAAPVRISPGQRLAPRSAADKKSTLDATTRDFASVSEERHRA